MTDEGSATIWVLIAMSLVGLATACAGLLGGGLLARERAEVAADAAALAGAGAVPHGRVAACRAADVLAVANGGSLVSCSPRGRSIQVEVSVSPPWPTWLGPAQRAVASAGPADAITADKIRTSRSFRSEIESADSRNLGAPAFVAPVTGSRIRRRPPSR